MTPQEKVAQALLKRGAQQERERLREKVRTVLSREEWKDGTPVVRAQWLVDVFLADPKDDR